MAVRDGTRRHRDRNESRRGVAGGGEDTCQVERAAADLVVYREVAIRKCMRRAAEHPDDVLHPVRRAWAQRTELFSATIYIGSINILPGK